MDLSNKSLALLLLATIVISLGGTLISIMEISQLQGASPVLNDATGNVAGFAAVNITDFAGCSIDSNVNFGSNTTLATSLTTERDNSADGFNNCIDASSECAGLQINNTGNLDVNVNFSSNQAASAFLGGPSVVSSDFQYRVFNGTANATRVQEGCFNFTGVGPVSGWTDVSTTQTIICQNLSFSDTTDMMTVEFNITLRTDTPGGQKNATITVNCNQN